MKKYLYILLLTLLTAACSSKKAIQTQANAIKEMSARKVAKKHAAHYFQEKTIDAKLKVNYRNDKERLGFSVRMKIEKDKAIWLKGTKLITIFKAKITPEKVRFYSPYTKSYFDGDFAMLKKLLGTDINFEQLQNLLLGQAIFDVKSKRQQVNIVENSYRLSPKRQSRLFDVFFYINPFNYKLNKQSLINPIGNQRLDVSYPKYLDKKKALFPNKINIVAKANQKSTNIDMTVRSIQFNTRLNLDFSIPKGYKEIQL